MKKRNVTGLWFACLLLLSIPLAGQRQKPVKDVPITLESPYNTILVHLHYLQPDTYQPDSAARVIYTIDDPETAVRRAIQLKQVLDGLGLYVRIFQLPDDPDYIDSITHSAIYAPFPRELPDVYVEKVNGRWYYSEETIERTPALHKQVYPFGADLLLNLLPRLGHNEVLGLALWQYAGLLIIFLMAFALHFILSRLLNPIVGRLSRSRLNPSLIHSGLVWSIARLVSILIVIKLIQIFLPVLQLPAASAGFAMGVTRIVITVLFLLLGLRVLDVFMAYMHQLTLRTANRLDEQLVPIIKRILQAVVIIWAVFQIMYILNVNVTALIAGVSIGGLALALAAQDTVKNLIGSTMIFVDRPFQIGDYVIAGDVEGVIVEVGFRTTRFRRIDSSIVSVPNGTIANMSITNLGAREHRLLNTDIAITYDTPPDLIEAFMEGLKELIEAHPKTRKEGYHVRFKNLGSFSLDIFFRVPIETADYADELRIKEELLLGVVRLAEKLGVRFAFPSSTMYIEEFPGQKSLTPHYDVSPDSMRSRREDFAGFYRKYLDERYPENGEGEI
jgi:MscS family membrane protein